MSFAIQTSNGPLVFGSFTSDFSLEEKYPDGLPVDLISDLGTDIITLVPITGSEPDQQTFFYNETGQDYFRIGRYYRPDGVLVASVFMRNEIGGADMLDSAVKPEEKEQLGVYLMAFPGYNSPQTKVVLVSKIRDKETGTITYYLSGVTTNYYVDYFKDYSPYEPPTAQAPVGLADKTSDPVDFPPLPLVSALGTGTVNMYRATQTSLRDFSQFLWTGDFIDNVKKLFQDPMEALISVQIVPYSPPQADTLSNVHMSWIDTGVQMYPLTNQFLEINCGTLTVSEFWGSFLDYPPNTEISIFLPYVGLKSLSVQDVMDRTIELRYHVDCLTGTCLAMLKCSGNGLNSVLYSWSGSCNTQIPIAARDFSSIYSSVIGLVSTAGIAAATGGSGVAAKAAVGAAAGVSALKSATLDTHVRQSGSVGSTPSYLGIQKPFIIISRPLDSTPTDFNEQTGRPSNLTGTVGDFSGYLECTYCHLENLVATDAEKREIESLLKSGIFL